MRIGRDLKMMRFSLRDTASCQLAVLCILLAFTRVAADICEDGRMCQYPDRCCDTRCCAAPNYHDTYRAFKWSVWNMWYFWFIVIFVLMSCFGGCGYLRRRQLVLSRRMSATDFTTVHMNGPLGFFSHRGSRQTSTFSSSITIPVFFSRERSGPRPAPQRSRAATEVHQAAAAMPTPPSYSEVVSKPENYPIYNKDKLPPYPGLTDEAGSALHLSGQSRLQPALPPYTPFPENGPNQTGAMPSDPRQTPPPSYGT